MKATLLFDGQKINRPEEMGQPMEGQLQGSALDQLAEIAGRVSYDSLGRGRPSTLFHENLRAERHNSVFRHLNLTFQFDTDQDTKKNACLLGAIIGRPGVHLTDFGDGYVTEGKSRITCNLQAAMEWWERQPKYRPAAWVSDAMGRLIRNEFYKQAPLAAKKPEPVGEQDEKEIPGFVLVEPQLDEEIYASLFLSDISRVAADELLRHSFQCSPSMESTRYVDYSKRNWVPHPLLRLEGKEYDWCRENFKRIEIGCRAAYNGLVNTLSMVNPDAGVKQIRGAARGLIGLSAGTRLVFTASLEAWRCIFRQRISPHADAEIREVCEAILPILAYRWPESFEEAGS